MRGVSLQMPNYLLEIGCEEIPARFVQGLLENLRENVEKQLTAAGISGFQIIPMGTYRRLAIRITGLPAQQADQTLRNRGPATNVGKSADGSFLPPAIGFAKRFGLTADQLIEEEVDGKTYLVAVVDQKGQPISAILAGIVPQAVTGINCPIAMRWGNGDHTFIRPVHWILSLLDDKIVPFDLLGQNAGNESRGHRMLTHHPKLAHLVSGVPIKISHEKDYEVSLRNHEVEVLQNERREKIASALAKQIEEASIDQALVHEVTFLTEQPKLLEGQFNPDYLQVPEAVLIEVMRKHQKYFPLKTNGKLAPKFLFVADNVQGNNAQQIIAGNESVLRARLEDAKYFYEEDRKRKLIDRADGLKSVLFQKNLGSTYEKAVRNGQLLVSLSGDIGILITENEVAHAAVLAKCDLVTQMVSELPALQGQVGELLARLDGETEAATTAIFEHYLPRFSGDALPQTDLGYGLALADKLDTLVCCYVNNLLPTGSQDPWGVRRNCNGLFTLLFTRNIDANLKKWVDIAYANLNKGDANKDKLLTLLSTRLRQFIIDQLAIPFDIVDAVSDRTLTGIQSTVSLMKALQTYRDQQPALFKSIAESGIRIGRLLKKAEISPNTQVDPKLFKVPLEQDLADVIAPLTAQSEWSDVAKMVALLGQYFEEIMVMDPDPAVRANRVAFLKGILSGPLRSIDFEKIVLS